MVLTQHAFKISKDDVVVGGGGGGKRGKKRERDEDVTGHSNLMLIVNNWGFVRDTQEKAKVRQCELSNFQVQLKLSSTAFRNAQNPDTTHPYDRHSANFNFDSFVFLMNSESFRTWMREVKRLYEEQEGPMNLNESNPTVVVTPPVDDIKTLKK